MAFSLQQWNLAHPQNVNLSEVAMLTHASRIQRYENRSGIIYDNNRAPPPPAPAQVAPAILPLPAPLLPLPVVFQPPVLPPLPPPVLPAQIQDGNDTDGDIPMEDGQQDEDAEMNMNASSSEADVMNDSFQSDDDVEMDIDRSDEENSQGYRLNFDQNYYSDDNNEDSDLGEPVGENVHGSARTPSPEEFGNDFNDVGFGDEGDNMLMPRRPYPDSDQRSGLSSPLVVHSNPVNQSFFGPPLAPPPPPPQAAAQNPPSWHPAAPPAAPVVAPPTAPIVLPPAAPILPPPVAPVVAPAGPSASYLNFANSQIANHIRLGWQWRSYKVTGPYIHQIVGKWWYMTQAEIDNLDEKFRANWYHIGRIMETELGEQLLGNDRCSWCQEKNFECWKYSSDGATQILRPGDSCARCRVQAHAGGCTLSKRRSTTGTKSTASPQKKQQSIAPRPSPSSGAGGTGIST